MAINLCGVTIDDYASVLLKLMPRGIAWNTSAESNQAKILASYAAGMAAYNDAMCLLLAETAPCNSTALLSEWGRMLALPSNCGASFFPTDTAGQQEILCAAYTQLGGASADYLESRLDALGIGTFTISDSLHYAVCGDECETPILDGNASLFLIDGLYDYEGAVCQQLVCNDECDTPLIVCDDDALDYLNCTLHKIKPAHTSYVFTIPEGY